MIKSNRVNLYIIITLLYRLTISINAMKYTIAIFLLLINYNSLISCSCSYLSFCGAMRAAEESVVFKGETIKVKHHYNGYHSAVIKVLTKINGEQLLTDTIELFGGIHDGGCEVKLNLEVGDVNYYAFIALTGTTIDITQFEHESENYWVSDVNLCLYSRLTIDGEFVRGRVSKEFDSYPLESFENDLVDCSFSIKAFQEYLCPDFTIYPNPVKNNLFLKSTDDSRLIDELKIYSTSGQLLFEADPNQILDRNISLSNFDENLVILEIKCGEEKIVQKIVIVQ